MPIVMDGYVVVSTRKLAEHRGHDIGIADTDPRVIEGPSVVALHCDTCGSIIEREYRSTSLPCGCGTAAEHAEGVAIQEKYRKRYRYARSTCIGCALGDDGPSIHSCYIHPC